MIKLNRNYFLLGCKFKLPEPCYYEQLIISEYYLGTHFITHHLMSLDSSKYQPTNISKILYVGPKYFDFEFCVLGKKRTHSALLQSIQTCLLSKTSLLIT